MLKLLEAGSEDNQNGRVIKDIRPCAVMLFNSEMGTLCLCFCTSAVHRMPKNKITFE